MGPPSCSPCVPHISGVCDRSKVATTQEYKDEMHAHWGKWVLTEGLEFPPHQPSTAT